MYPVSSTPQRLDGPQMVYPLQMQCVSQPLPVSNCYAPVVYTPTTASKVVLINESPPRPPLCNPVFLSGPVQGVPQQVVPQPLVSPEPRFSPGTAPQQFRPLTPYIGPRLPPPLPLEVTSSQPSPPGQRITSDTPQQFGPSNPYLGPQLPPHLPLRVASSQSNPQGQRPTSETKMSGNMNLNRGFPLPTTPYGFLDGTPQMSTCSTDTLLDGSKKEFMVTRAEKVSLWRTFASVFHNSKNTEMETTDNSLLAVFLGLPSHIRRAIRHQGGIGAFLNECPWFLVNGDKVVLVPCMEKLYTCQDDDITESAEKEKETKPENNAEVPDTWEDLSISDIEEGGYFGDYVPSEPENSDGENTQKSDRDELGTKTSTEYITSEYFLVGKKEKETLMVDGKKPKQLESFWKEKVGKNDGEEDADDKRDENKSKKALLDEEAEALHFVKDGEENADRKCSENGEVFGGEKLPSSNDGVLSDCEGLLGDGKREEVGNETRSESQSVQDIQQKVHGNDCEDKFVTGRDLLKEETGEHLVDARGDGSVYIVLDETYLSLEEIWDESDDPDSDELNELFEKVDLSDRATHGDCERPGRDTEIEKSEIVTEGAYKASKGDFQSPNLIFKSGTTKDAETSSIVERRDKMMQTRDDNLKYNVQTDVSDLGVGRCDDEKEVSGRDASSQTLELINQSEVKKIMIDCCVESCDLKPLQMTVSTCTEPVLQKTVGVSTDPALEEKECSDKCKKMLSSCKSDLQKATLEQMETEGRLCQTVSKLKQVERECTLLKEIRGSVIADLIKAKDKPHMEEKSTSADLTFDGDALKKLQKSLSEAKVKLLHGNLKNVELQSKLAFQLISQAYEESEIIYSMKRMSISRKASLTTQVMKYQRQLQSHKEAVDEWKRKSEAFLMAGGIIEKLPLFPQIDIEKFTPEVPTRGPLRHPSQPSASEYKLAANFTGQPVTSAVNTFQTSSAVEVAATSVPLGGHNHSKVSPLSTFTPNKKSDRPGTDRTFKGGSTCNQQYAASVPVLVNENLIENMGCGASLNLDQLTERNTSEKIESAASLGKNQPFPPNEKNAQSAAPEKISDSKPDAIFSGKDTHRQNQHGSTVPSSVDNAILDLKLDEVGNYQPNSVDAYRYMQQTYSSQYDYSVDPYYWFVDASLGFPNGQFSVAPSTNYESVPAGNYQSCDEAQIDINKQGGNIKSGQKSKSDGNIGGATSPIAERSDEQPLSHSTPSVSPGASPTESKASQENKPSILSGKRDNCNLQGEVKSPIDVKPFVVEPLQQETTSHPSRQMPTGSSPFIFDLPSVSESEGNHPKSKMVQDETLRLPHVNADSLAATSQLSHKSPTLEPTTVVERDEAKQIFMDQVTSPQFQKVSIDKSTICHPNQVKSGKRMASPSLQANIGLDNFDNLSVTSPKKKRVLDKQKEQRKKGRCGEDETESDWIHLVGKRKKRSQEQTIQKKQAESVVAQSSYPGEDEIIPSYFSLTHLLRKLSEMFPNESRLSLTSIILKVRANHRGQLDKVPFAVIISEAVSLLTGSDSSDEKRQNAHPPSAKKLEDSPESLPQPSKPTQKSGQLTKLLKNLMERFPNKDRSDLVDAIVQIRKQHGNTLGGMAMAQVLFEVTQCLHSLDDQKQVDKQNEEEKDCCTVCLAPLKTTQLVRELECAHRFHDQCIQLWFEKRERTCPVCRTHALLEDEFPRLQ